MGEQNKQERERPQGPQVRAKFLEGLQPFYCRGIDEPYPEIAMIDALTGLLVESKSKRGLQVSNDDMAWLLMLIGDLARKIEKDVDAIYADTGEVWDELEQRALDLEREVAALNGDQGRTAS